MLKMKFLGQGIQKLFFGGTLTLTSCDLDLDPMTLIIKLDLDIVKMHLPAKNQVSRSSHSKVRARTVTQTFLSPVTLTLTS